MMGDPSVELWRERRSLTGTAGTEKQFSEGNLEEAVEHLTIAILLNPNSPTMCFWCYASGVDNVVGASSVRWIQMGDPLVQVAEEKRDASQEAKGMAMETILRR